MNEVADLLSKHGAPLPRAMALETEVRSEGALMLQTLNVPSWASNLLSSGVLAEWRCTLSSDVVGDLQSFLKTVLPSGVTSQEAINTAFNALDIGTYLGTFVEEGLLVDGQATVRMLFAYRSTTHGSIEAINQAIHGLLTNTGAQKEAGDALSKLRDFWRKGSDKFEGGLMMLSEINLYDPGRSPYTRAALTP